LRGTDL